MHTRKLQDLGRTEELRVGEWGRMAGDCKDRRLKGRMARSSEQF